jgi:hypothetical protein
MSMGKPRCRLIRRRGFPQHEIQRVPLVGCHFDPGAGAQAFRLSAGEGAVRRIGGHVEQDMPLIDVGMAALDQCLDQFDDVGDMLGDPGFRIGRQDRQGLHVFVVGVNKGLREGRDGHAPGGRGLLDLVVDIGKVADVAHLGIVMPEQACQDVKDHGRSGIANVGVVIDSGAADIQSDSVGPMGPEAFLPAGEGVVQPDAVLSHEIGSSAWAVALRSDGRAASMSARSRF